MVKGVHVLYWETAVCTDHGRGNVVAVVLAVVKHISVDYVEEAVTVVEGDVGFWFCVGDTANLLSEKFWFVVDCPIVLFCFDVR